jgi:hypothetical protein
MGVESSTPLPKHFLEISKWPKSRIDAIIKSYNDGDYDFGIDYNVVMNITGMDIEQAASLHKAHLKNDSGIINAITLLISIISLGNSDSTRNEVQRLELIFDLLDFNRNNQISSDELSILLLCTGSSFSFILGRPPDEHPLDAQLISFTKMMYDKLGKKYNSLIKKEELVRWCRENLFGKGCVNINDILKVLKDGLDALGDVGDEEKEGEGGGEGKAGGSQASSVTGF